MDFDFSELMQQIKDPTTGLPIIGVLVLLNALLGILVAHKDQTFDRYYLLNFLETRVIYQALPVAAAGFGAIYLHMPLLSWFYVTTAAVMAGDLIVDLKEKMGDLFGKS